MGLTIVLRMCIWQLTDRFNVLDFLKIENEALLAFAKLLLIAVI